MDELVALLLSVLRIQTDPFDQDQPGYPDQSRGLPFGHRGFLLAVFPYALKAQEHLDRRQRMADLASTWSPRWYRSQEIRKGRQLNNCGHCECHYNQFRPLSPTLW